MSTEQLKQNLRRIFDEGFNQNRPMVWDELIHPEYVNHNFPAPTPGVEGFKHVGALFLEAFPDMRLVVEDTIAEGNKVVSRGYFIGTHQGHFMDIPATGRSIKVFYIDIWTVEDGKFKENWVQMDMLGMLQQLGVVPMPGEAAA